MSAPIFAHHAHVFPEVVKAAGTIDMLLAHLDAASIERAVCFAPFARQVVGTDVQPNRWLASALKSHRRLLGFGTIDIHGSGLRDQVREVADLGFKGLKLHPNQQEFDILSPAALEIYAAAEELNLFITFHSGVHRYRLANYQVTKFDEVAWQFPKLRFSLEHVGGWSFFNEAVAVIVNNIPFPPTPDDRCRVFAGLTSVFTEDYLPFWYMSPERMQTLVRQVGAEQIIFGLDFPYHPVEHTLRGISAIRALGLTDAQQELILGGNLGRELQC